MPGPLPNPSRRRRNAPIIPTTKLPSSGYSGVVPEVPSWFHLGPHGTEWYWWAWSTPQAAAWSSTDADIVARRASLVDDFAALSRVESLEIWDVLKLAKHDQAREAQIAIEALARLAGNHLAVQSKMNDLDDRLGLSPKAMAALRWTIFDDAEPAVKPAKVSPSNVTSIGERRKRVNAS